MGTPPWTSGHLDRSALPTVTGTPGANPATVDATRMALPPTQTWTLAITQTAGDKNRVTDTVTVSAHTGVAGASTGR